MNVGAKNDVAGPSTFDQLAANNNNSNNHPIPQQPTSPVVKQPNDARPPQAEFINEELHPELVSNLIDKSRKLHNFTWRNIVGAKWLEEVVVEAGKSTLFLEQIDERITVGDADGRSIHRSPPVK